MWVLKIEVVHLVLCCRVWRPSHRPGKPQSLTLPPTKTRDTTSSGQQLLKFFQPNFFVVTACFTSLFFCSISIYAVFVLTGTVTCKRLAACVMREYCEYIHVVVYMFTRGITEDVFALM